METKRILNEADSSGYLMIIDDELKKKLQSVLLEILEDVYQVCLRHDISIFLVGGSALGAVRHKGFIPWDDDIDISMTRKDYEQFKTVFESELGDKYILCAPNYSGRSKSRFPKVLKKGTYLEEIIDSKDKDLCKIFLDIFILESYPENKTERRLRGIYCNALEAVSGMVFFVENADAETKAFYKKASKANYAVRSVIGRLCSFKNSQWWFDAVDSACNYRGDSSLVGLPTGRTHYFGEIFERERLFPLIPIEFEGKEYPIFTGYDLYLSNLYGDYMQLPPIEKREKHFVKKMSFDETDNT